MPALQVLSTDDDIFVLQPPHEYVDMAFEQLECDGRTSVPWPELARLAWEMHDRENTLQVISTDDDIFVQRPPGEYVDMAFEQLECQGRLSVTWPELARLAWKLHDAGA